MVPKVLLCPVSGLDEADKEDSFEDGQDRGGEVVSQNPVARKSKYS